MGMKHRAPCKRIFCPYTQPRPLGGFKISKHFVLKIVMLHIKLKGMEHRAPCNARVHYVPGSHGSHGSQKRSSPWCFESFLSLCSSSVKSRYVFTRSVKVCRDRGSPARYGLSRMVLRFLPACHVLLGPLTFCYVAIKFCYVYRVLSRFSTMKRGRWVVF